MQKINLIIATRNRVTNLLQTIKSVPDSWNIHIMCDGDYPTYAYLYQYIKNTRRPLTVYHNSEIIGSVKARNKLTARMTDGCLYGADDIIFNNQAAGLLDLFNDLFPDDDGVLGLKQNTVHNDHGHPAAFALVGQRFLARYPKQQLFYPQYYHFACQEVYWLANKLNKWMFTYDIILQHAHPQDQTTAEARQRRDNDLSLLDRREVEGRIWGYEPGKSD